MLLLKSHEVEHWEISYDDGGLLRVIPVIGYKGKVYAKGNVFPKDQQHNALKEMREKFLDGLQHIPCILVESDRGFTIWYEDPKVNALTNNPGHNSSNIQAIDLEEVVSRIVSTGGMKIQNRWYKLKFYPKSFIGSDAVDWFVSNYKISRDDAVLLGMELLKRKYIYHVLHQGEFRDDSSLYRFH